MFLAYDPGVMVVTPVKTRLFLAKENLVDFIVEHIPTVSEGAVLVVTSKIVSLAEGRTTTISDSNELLKLMKKESELAVETPYTWMTVRQGMAMARAGFDQAGNDVLLLPKDSFASAHTLRMELCKRYGVRNLAVLLSDSRTLPLRKGSVGVCMGYAGLEPLKDYGQTRDMMGGYFRQRLANVVDALATAAVHTMGESDQMQPLAIIADADITFTDKPASPTDIQIAMTDDLYGPLFNALNS